MATDKDRGTDARQTGASAQPQPRVVFVPSGRGGLRGEIVQPPEEIVFEEEAPIAPSRKRQLQDQARTVLAKAAKGQHFKDDYLERVEQQLTKLGDEESSALAGAIRDLRASQTNKDAARMTADANRGLDGSKTAGKPEVPMAAGEEFSTTEEEWDSLVDDLAYEGALAKARGVADRFARGERVGVPEAQRTAMSVLEQAGQRARAGKEAEGVMEQVILLQGAVYSQFEKEAANVVGAEEKGVRAGEGYLEHLATTGFSMERQHELLGGEPRGGVELGLKLGDFRASRLEEEIRGVLDRAKRGEQFGTAYIDWLRITALVTERQYALIGRKTVDWVDLVQSLNTVSTLPLEQEARDVLARSGEGRRFNPGYVDFLRQRLIKDAGNGSPQGRELAQALEKVQRSWIVAEIRDVLARAKDGKSFEWGYLTYLKQRVLESETRESRDLADALDRLIG